MFKELISDAHDGTPLAVCVNDCEIDRGHSYSDLARICFQVGCAFAEMRWGRTTDKTQGFNILPPPQTYQILPLKAQG